MTTIPGEYDSSRCLQAIGDIEKNLGELAESMTECQFQAPPRAGGWSAAYCLEHLILTGYAFLGKWDSALASGLRDEGPFPYSWMGRKILGFAEPPYRIKVKTARGYAPCGRRSKEATVRRFLKMHQELAARISASRGMDASGIKVQSPFVSWVRYPLGLSFDLALAHERRHLWQARQVRRQIVDQE